MFLASGVIDLEQLVTITLHIALFLEQLNDDLKCDIDQLLLAALLAIRLDEQEVENDSAAGGELLLQTLRVVLTLHLYGVRIIATTIRGLVIHMRVMVVMVRL